MVRWCSWYVCFVFVSVVCCGGFIGGCRVFINMCFCIAIALFFIVGRDA